MRIHSADDPIAYFDRLKGSLPERKEFISLVVVPETYFYRDRRQFETLQKHVIPEIITRKSTPLVTKPKIKIVSCGCSFGTEPYSIAMALSEVGLFNKADIEIIAIEENAFIYDNPYGKQVLGTHNQMEIAGVPFAIIAEVEESEIFASTTQLRIVTSILLIGTVIAVVIIVIVISRLRDDLYQEITERKLIKENLRKLSQAVEQSPNPVMITDIEGNIEYINPRFTVLTGYTPEEVQGQTPRML